MPDAQKTPWWQTLPAILTGLAGLIGAIATLLTVLSQDGIFTAKPKESASPALPHRATFPPYEASAINIWIVGSPHTGDLPSSRVPSEIADNARDLLVSLDVKTFPAKDFAAAFFAAFESNSGPDVLVIDNYGHIDRITTDLGSFPGIASRAQVRDSLIGVSESFSSFGMGWEFLFANSRNHQKPKALPS